MSLHKLTFIFSISLFILISNVKTAFTQSKKEGIIEQYYLNKARLKFVDKNYVAAEKLYIKVLEQNPKSIEAYQQLTEIYKIQNRIDKLTYTLEKAQQKCPSCVSENYKLIYATALAREGNYSRAKFMLGDWKPANTATPKTKLDFQQLQQNINFGLRYPIKPTDIYIKNLGDSVNSKYDEYFPTLLPNKKEMIITRKNNGVDEDFFWTTKDTCDDWLAIRDLGSPPNSTKQEGAHARSFDGYYLFFQQCGNNSIDGFELGGCDLYFSYSPDGRNWKTPMAFGYTINTIYFEGMPCISPDNKRLYFVSDRPGGYGGMDIWYAPFENGKWQKPVNLGPKINTSGDETAPFIAADNQHLYFTSNGHPGYGGNDLFVASLDYKNQWDSPVNLGFPINTPFDEVSAYVIPEGDTIYFASNRTDGYGGYDIYQGPLLLKHQSKPYSTLYGKVMDAQNKELKKRVNIEFYQKSTNKLIRSVESNLGDGSYKVLLPIQDSIRLKIDYPSYQCVEQDLFIIAANNTVVDTMDILLKPLGFQEDIIENDNNIALNVANLKYTLLGLESAADESISLYDLVELRLKNIKISNGDSIFIGFVGENEDLTDLDFDLLKDVKNIVLTHLNNIGVDNVNLLEENAEVKENLLNSLSQYIHLKDIIIVNQTNN